jgi:hypothetical protein
MGVNLSDVAPGGRNHDPDRRCIQRFQVYRLSAQTDPLLVWRLTRCDAPGGSTHAQYAGVENVSRSFHAHREPQQSTCLGLPHDKSSSRSRDGSFLMRLPSAPNCACAPAAATSLRLTRIRVCGSKRKRAALQKRRQLRLGGFVLFCG